MFLGSLKRYIFLFFFCGFVCQLYSQNYSLDENGYYYLKTEISEPKTVKQIDIIYNTDPHGYTNKVSRIVNYINQVKSEPNSLSLFLFGGDEPRGYPIWGFYKNRIGYQLWSKYSDAAAIGNHDLIHYGADHLNEVIKTYKLPAIGTNIIDKRTHTYPYPRYKIIKYGKENILILGFTTQTINHDARVNNDLYFETPSDSYNELLPKILKNNKISNIFIIAHLDYRTHADGCQTLNEFIQKIGGKNILVLHGHEHFSDFNIIKNADGEEVPVISSLDKNQELKHITLLYDDESGTFVYRRFKTVKVDSELKEDPITKKFIKDYLKNEPVPEKYKPLLVDLFDNSYVNGDGIKKAFFWDGSRELLNNKPVEQEGHIIVDYPITNLIGDAFRKTMNANVSFMESTNIRASLTKEKITGLDILNIIPFENNLALASLSGKIIEQIVNDGLSTWSRRLYFTGLKLYYLEKEKKFRISEIYNPVLGRYEAIDYDKKYTVTAIDNFMDINLDPDDVLVVTDLKDYNVVIDYIKKQQKKGNWIRSYQQESNFCPIVRNGKTNAKTSDLDETYPPLNKQEYLSLLNRTSKEIELKYAHLNYSERVIELQMLLDKLNLNHGYLPGLSPTDNISLAINLVENSSAMFDVWANLASMINPVLLEESKNIEEAKLYFEEWRARFSLFVLLSDIMRDTYPYLQNTKTTIIPRYEELKEKALGKYRPLVTSNEHVNYVHLVLTSINYIRNKYTKYSTDELKNELKARLLTRMDPVSFDKFLGELPSSAYMYINDFSSLDNLIAAKDDIDAKRWFDVWKKNFINYSMIVELLDNKNIDSEMSAYVEKITQKINKCLSEKPVKESFFDFKLNDKTQRQQLINQFLKEKFNSKIDISSFYESYPLRLKGAEGIGAVSKEGVIIILESNEQNKIQFNSTELPYELIKALEKENEKGFNAIEIMNLSNKNGATNRFFIPMEKNNEFESNLVIITTLSDEQKYQIEEILFNTIDKQKLLTDEKLLAQYNSYLERKELRSQLMCYLGLHGVSDNMIIEQTIGKIYNELEIYGQLKKETLSLLAREKVLNYIISSTESVFLKGFFNLFKDILELDKAGAYRTDYYMKSIELELLKSKARDFGLVRSR